LAISISSGNKLLSNNACHSFEISKSADPIAPHAPISNGRSSGTIPPALVRHAQRRPRSPR
jgi:hypothetical protein